jgi:periplasmic divalent cation tolerance protein
MSEAIVMLCTAPDATVGEKLARGLVEEKLAACVNVLPPMISVYAWKGELQREPEVQLVIKTRRELGGEVERWIVANHPYEVPEVLALPIASGSAKYLAWVREQTGR